jgi:acetyl esterase/lipase
MLMCLACWWLLLAKASAQAPPPTVADYSYTDDCPGPVDPVHCVNHPVLPLPGCQDGLINCKMDLYMPPDGRAERMLVFVHGGTWVGGSKDNLKIQAPIPEKAFSNWTSALRPSLRTNNKLRGFG